MTLHELPDIEQGSEEWFDQRRGMVTASVVGRLLTATGKVADNDYSRGLTALLAAERITGYTEPTWMNADMQRGVGDEPRARDLYSKHYAPVTETGFLVRREPTWTLGFSPDGLVGDDGLIEIKSRRSKKHIQTVLSGQVPAENVAQCQAGLLVSGRDWLDYVSYSGGLSLWVTRIYPDAKWFDAIIAAVEAFETNVEQVANDYLAKVVGFPMTERHVELEMVI